MLKMLVVNLLVRRMNNVLCLFSSLNSVLKYRLFTAYCSDIYGCELRRIDDSIFDSFCVKCGVMVQGGYGICRTKHTVIRYIIMLADDLPIFDIINKRIIVKFVVCCLNRCNAFINFVAWQSALFECVRSLLGWNLQFWCDWYVFRLCDVFGPSFNINYC